jgi:hypothetical protein
MSIVNAKSRTEGVGARLSARGLFVARSHAETLCTRKSKREWTIQQRCAERRLTQNEMSR